MPRSDRNKNAPANWTRALSLAELGERSKAVVKLSGKQILLMQSGGKIYACNNRCPHEGFPLAEGTLSDGCILTCNWHSWRFNLEDGGYDAVTYFTSKPVIGFSDHSATYNDATYRFANAENMEKFKQDPAKYAPQYGGYCAFGASVGKKFDGDPRYWTIVDGKLYLNHNQSVLKRWRENPTDRIAKANKHWTEIAQKSPSDL